MAFPIEGLTFGDFDSLTAEEYNDLFGTGGKDLHGTYLELPWDEEENLQSVLRASQQAAAVAVAQLCGAQQQAATEQQQTIQHQQEVPSQQATQNQQNAQQQQVTQNQQVLHQQQVTQNQQNVHQQQVTQNQQDLHHQQVTQNQNVHQPQVIQNQQDFHQQQDLHQQQVAQNQQNLQQVTQNQQDLQQQQVTQNQQTVHQQQVTQNQQNLHPQQVLQNQQGVHQQQVAQSHQVIQNQQVVQQHMTHKQQVGHQQQAQNQIVQHPHVTQHQQMQQQPSLHQQQAQQYQNQQHQQQQYILQQQQQQTHVPAQQHVHQHQGVNYLQQPVDVAVNQQQQQYVVDNQRVPTSDTTYINTGNEGGVQMQGGGQVYMQPAAVPLNSALQADMYSDKPEEGAQSSDGGNTDDLSGDGKRRRNKKRRDPNYYKNYYEKIEKPVLLRSQDSAYYADNESSSGSSGNTSEVHSASQDVPDSTVIDMTGWEKEQNMNYNVQMMAPMNRPPVAPNMQQQAVNRTSGMHHEYVANPTYVQDGATIILTGQGQTIPAVPHAVAHPPPPGLQHSAAAAAAAAIQLQRSPPPPQPTPATSNVQNIITPSGQRTTQPGQHQVLSNPMMTGDAVSSPQSVSKVVPRKLDNVANATPDGSSNNTLNNMVMQKPQQNMNQEVMTTPAQTSLANVPQSTTPVSSTPHTTSASIESDNAPNTQMSLQVSSPRASSSTSETPGSSTPIASPSSTPVASPQPPVETPPEATVNAPESESSQSATIPTPSESVPDESGPVESAAVSKAVDDKQTPARAPVPAPATAPAPAPAPAPASTPAPAPAKPTSWAGLFKSSSAASAPVIINTPYTNSTTDDSNRLGIEQQNNRNPVSPSDDPRAKELAGLLSTIPLSYRNAFLRPRGLTNTGNWCYINSILQALVACPPLTNLIKALPNRSSKQQNQEATSTPMLNALVHFVNMFSPVPLKVREKSREIRPGPSFEPIMIYNMLSAVNISLIVKQGRQEDAEEFLSCLLNGLHEEMLAVLGTADKKKGKATTNGPASGDAYINNKHVEGNHIDDAKPGQEEKQEEEDDDEWEQVGPKNKSSVTRGAHFTQTPLSKIFGGQMRSALHQQGSRESATLQPFFTLQLDIQDEKIWSVRDALDSLGLRESLQGFTCNKTKMEVEATRRITLEELPPVLILHLKCFVYDKTGGCQKLIKKLDYNMDLEISKDLLSPTLKTRASLAQRSFRLMAVVYHVGKEASGGHYITDVFHSGLNTWLRMDDSIVRFIKGHQVIKPQASLTPYLLFYRRNDCSPLPSQ